MSSPILLALNATTSTAALRRRLAPAFRLRSEGGAGDHVERLYIDTFDWRVFARGHLLYLEEDRLILARPDGQALTAVAPGLERELPCFIEDLPEGELRSALEPVGSLRALMPVRRVNVEIERYAVHDDIDKTIGYLTVERAADGFSPAIAGLVPLRGCAGEAAQLARAAPPTAERISEAERMRLRLAGGGREPGAYSTKIAIAIAPQTPAADAARRVIGSFLAIMRENEAGLRTRIDTEFLHDFRIALRRLRSYVSLAKESLSAELTDRLKSDLKRIWDLTGPPRDFDVLLLRREEYRAMLTEELEPGLERYFERVRTRTDEAYGRLTGFMAGPEYARIMEEWQRFAELAETPAEAFGAAGARPIASVAPRWLSKRLRQVADGIDAVAGGAPDERMHELRKDGKRLRYLIEILASLYPPKTASRLVKQLKDFQDALGELNDLSVQETTLKDDLTRVGGRNPEYVEIAAAIGGLLTQLRSRRPALYAAYEEAAGRYRSEIAGTSVSRMLAHSAEEGEPA